MAEKALEEMLELVKCPVCWVVRILFNLNCTYWRRKNLSNDCLESPRCASVSKMFKSLLLRMYQSLLDSQWKVSLLSESVRTSSFWFEMMILCRTEIENLVRCPWLNDVCQMAAKAGESLRKCAVHQDKVRRALMRSLTFCSVHDTLWYNKEEASLRALCVRNSKIQPQQTHNSIAGRGRAGEREKHPRWDQEYREWN